MKPIVESMVVRLDQASISNLTNITPGTIQCYYRGTLAKDIQEGALDAIYARHQAQHAFDAGAVYLLQKQMGPDDYLYLAVGRKLPRLPRKTPFFLNQDPFNDSPYD